MRNNAEQVFARVAEKFRRTAPMAAAAGLIPYRSEGGQWLPSPYEGNAWWTGGFWPGLMLQLYAATKDDLFLTEARRTEALLTAEFRTYEKLNHDVGFMYLLSCGADHKLTGDTQAHTDTLHAASLLMGRYNPVGFIRAWNGTSQYAIVDCMMNLPLLYWASEQSGDPRYRLIAMKHADTAMTAFVRPDGSCNHIVIFDPETGEILDNPGGQGYESGSSWSRGQSWALYGFVLSYLHTGKQVYLDTAKRVANYFISQCADDDLPRCDFRQPAEPLLRDNAAGNIAACGLMELARLVPEGEASLYFNAAIRMLKAQEADAANWETNDPFIFTKCTSAYHDMNGRHMTMDYADYYFAEAIGKLRGETMLFWYPNRDDAQ